MSNIVRTLPENLGDLKNLKFLNLANNKDLVSLPESIKDIPNLALLNLKKANPNVVIPPALKEVLSDEGEGFFYLT
jgi:Leucine-rich repeat (LRR) protein